MRILFLGHSDYLRKIIYYLEGSSFLAENNIDIMFASSSSASMKWRKIKKLNFNRVVYIINLLIFRHQNKIIIDKLFPLSDISFINSYSNINIMKYNGLYNISNLENYDFMIVASFGEIIPSEIFKMPKRGTLNIHPSYLPNLRGGYPNYVEAYMKSDEGGTTIHFMSKKFDRGTILIQNKYSVSQGLNSNERYSISAECAARLLNVLHSKDFNIKPITQSNKQATYCKKILKHKNEIENIYPNENLLGYIRANKARHLFPFMHSCYRFTMVSILDIKLVNNVSILPQRYRIKKKNRIFKYHNDLYLAFYGQLFKITKYIWKGKLYN